MAYEVDLQLACWMRKTRLLCPHTGDAKKYWIEQANLNLPVLALATLELPDRDIAFTYTQSVASAVWTINHNLGFNPTAVVLDSTAVTATDSTVAEIKADSVIAK